MEVGHPPAPPQWLATQEQMGRTPGLESLDLSPPGPEGASVCRTQVLLPLWYRLASVHSALFPFLFDAAPLTPSAVVCLCFLSSGSRPFLCVPCSADTLGSSPCFSSFQPPAPSPEEASSLRSLKWECFFFNVFLATLVFVAVRGLSLAAASGGYTLMELRLLLAVPSLVVERVSSVVSGLLAPQQVESSWTRD